MHRIQRRVTVPEGFAGRRLDQAAAALWDDFSRSRLKAWIETGELTVAGQAAEPKMRLAGGEALILDAALAPAVEVAPEAIDLAVLHADSDIFVIDKPAGLVVHPGAGNRSGTLQNALLALDPAIASVPRAGIVHRLDKNTTGLLVIARNLTAHERLVAMIAVREVGRVYEAVCQGVLTGGGRVDAPLDRHPRDRTRMAVAGSGGRPARTSYRVLERFRAQTHVELELDTGRTHQIRVHMAHIGAPLVGDPVYGGRPRFPKQPSDVLRTTLGEFGRQALHARRLRFAHPTSRVPLEFESPLPADFTRLLAVLRDDRERAPA